MIEKVENYLKEIFPICQSFKIEKVGEIFKCEYSTYVSDSFGNPILRTNKINVGIVDGFFKIVE